VAETGSPTASPQTNLDDDYTHDIFLSHLQRNAQNTVIAMNLFLRDAAPGVRTFIDLEVNMNKKGGLQNALRNGVRRSRALLFFITDGIFKSEWCCQELRWAREMGRTIILVNETDARHGGTYPRVSPTRIATRIATRHTPHATRPALIACAGGAALCACCRHRHEGGNQAGARRPQVSAARQGTRPPTERCGTFASALCSDGAHAVLNARLPRLPSRGTASPSSVT
jgi:hypothetical protein